MRDLKKTAIPRRQFLAAISASLTVPGHSIGVAGRAPGQTSQQAIPYVAGNEPQFFLDESWIERSDGVTLEVSHPRKAGVALAAERPWESYRISATAILEHEGVAKMWYTAYSHWPGVKEVLVCPRCQVRNPGTKLICVKCGWPLPTFKQFRAEGIHECYAISKDGVHWERPELGLVEFQGSKKNNIIPHAPGVYGLVPALDPQARPEDRFMVIVVEDDNPFNETQGGPRVRSMAIWIYVSADGLQNWRKKTKVAALPFDADTLNQILFDPRLSKYVAYMRGFPGHRTVVRAEIDRLDQAPWPYQDHGHSRDETGTLYITDELETVMDIDRLDPPLRSLDINHPSVVFYRPGVYVAFPALFRKYPGGLDRGGRERHRYFAVGNDGTWETQLAVSRDGRKWTRPDRRPYVESGLWGGPEGGLVGIAPGIIVRGDEMYLYYLGQRVTHGVFDPHECDPGGSAIYRLAQPRDRFTAASSGTAAGSFRTPVFCYTGTSLELNIDCGGLGETRVQILDQQGKPLPGFLREDCDPVDLNQLSQVVTWRGRGDLSSLRGAPIRLEFFMRESRLYTFTFTGPRER